jgi:hypothetical protein
MIFIGNWRHLLPRLNSLTRDTIVFYPLSLRESEALLRADNRPGCYR